MCFLKKAILVHVLILLFSEDARLAKKFPVIPKPTWGHNVCHVLFALKLSTNSRRHLADQSFIFGIFIEARPGGTGTQKSSLGWEEGGAHWVGGKKKKKRQTCILSQGLFNRKQTTKQQQIRIVSSSLAVTELWHSPVVFSEPALVWTVIGQESLKRSHCWPGSQYKPLGLQITTH